MRRLGVKLHKLFMYLLDCTQPLHVSILRRYISKGVHSDFQIILQREITLPRDHTDSKTLTREITLI